MTYAELIQSQLAKDTPYAWYLSDCAKQHSRYDAASFREQAANTEAHLDACVVAANHGEDIRSWFDPDDWGSLFVLLAVALRRDDLALFADALQHIREDSSTHLAEIQDAFLWQVYPKLGQRLGDLFLYDSGTAKQAAIAIARALGYNIHPDIQQQAEADGSPGLLGEYCLWLADNRKQDKLPWIRSFYQHEDATLRFQAAKAGKLLGDPDAGWVLETYALQETLHTLEAINLLFINVSPTLLGQWLDKLWQADGISPRIRCYALAVAGLPEWVEKLFPLMVETEYARVAGEAFTLLTGIGIEDNNLDAREDGCHDCQGKEAGQAEEQTLSERRQTDPFISDWEDDLPYPCPDASSNWWDRHKSHFSPGQRYLAGKRLAAEDLQQVLQTGNQRQRYLAALHLRITYQQPWRDPRWPQWM